MTITLKQEHEKVIRVEIESGHFHNADEALDYAQAALKEKGRDRNGATERKNPAQFLMESPLAGAGLNLERQKDYGRLIELQPRAVEISFTQS